MLLRRSLSAMLFALSLRSAAAWAEPTDADRATARTLALEGQEAFDAKTSPPRRTASPGLIR